ncbi:MAG: metalloregulator ArsR/SmtB family transcription factor [Planctomycetes bacterium]|nr:metalloregulator ArsR/SmtB family transcription factor [Planctomycetota bacterium]
MEPETLFKALADRTRQRVLALLTRHELAVSELVEVLQQPQSTVSRHLKVLRDSQLIRDRRVGTTILCSSFEKSNDHDGSPLRHTILDWIGEQPLPTGLDERLTAVVHRRRRMSDTFFDEVGRRWDSVRESSFGQRFHLEAMWALLPSDWIVADIGTGTGYLLPLLATQFQRVIAVEPVARMLEAARNRVEAARLSHVELRAGDLSALPLKNGEVDLAVAALVLHHVPAPSEAVMELGRVVRPGGSVLIIEQVAHDDPGFHSRMQDQWWGLDPVDIIRWFREAGFCDARSRPLSTVDRAADAPELFVVTARRVATEPRR